MPKQSFDPGAERRRWLPYVVPGMLLSWAGLWGLLQLPVNGTTMAMFLLLLFAAVMTTVMPPLSYLNARFGRCRERRVYRFRFVRQSVWAGLCVALMAWLQVRRVLSLTLALVCIGVFALIETFLITRENTEE